MDRLEIITSLRIIDSKYIKAAEMLLSKKFTVNQIWQQCAPEISFLKFVFRFNRYYMNIKPIIEVFNEALKRETESSKQKRG